MAALLIVIALSCLGVSAARAAQSPEGWWLDSSGKAGILIAPCGAQLCGHIEWLRTPLNAAGQPKTDIHNPNAALRPRLLCGLAMLGGFSSDGAGGWQGGWIYDPETGNTYKSIMHVAADGSLRVRGYIGFPLLGRSEIMTRLATPPRPCAAG
jgi:uncharacterized protein (DUF2147 family)